MVEPTSAAGAVSLVTLAVAFSGPQTGPYIVIVMGSIGGGLWALSSTKMDTRLQGLWLMCRCILTAVVLTALIAESIGSFIHVSAVEAYAAVAFAIGALGNRWQDIFDSIKNRLQSVITRDETP